MLFCSEENYVLKFYIQNKQTIESYNRPFNFLLQLS